MSKVTLAESSRYFSPGGKRGSGKQMSFCIPKHITISVEYGLGVVMAQGELEWEQAGKLEEYCDSPSKKGVSSCPTNRHYMER